MKRPIIIFIGTLAAGAGLTALVSWSVGELDRKTVAYQLQYIERARTCASYGYYYPVDQGVNGFVCRPGIQNPGGIK